MKKLEDGALLPKRKGWQSEEGSFDLPGKTATGLNTSISFCSNVL